MIRVTMGIKWLKRLLKAILQHFWKSTCLSNFIVVLDRCPLILLVAMTISAHLPSWQAVVGRCDHLGGSILLAWFLSSRWLTWIWRYTHLSTKGQVFSRHSLWCLYQYELATKELCLANHLNWMLVFITWTMNENVGFLSRLDWLD